MHQSLFIVVMRDRHSGVSLSVHRTREGADLAIEEFKSIYDNLNASDWKERSYGQPVWCRYVDSHDDGPSAYIEIARVKP
jgi:hypothetical protein